MEVPKQNLAGKLREIFTPQGQKEKWLRNHQELVSQYADVNNGLTEEQRAQAMKSIEDKATKDSRWAVAGHWGALVTGLALLAGVGYGIKNPDVLLKIGDIKLGRGENPFTIKTSKIGTGANFLAQHAHDFIGGIHGRAADLAANFRDRGAAAVDTVREGMADFSAKVKERSEQIQDALKNRKSPPPATS